MRAEYQIAANRANAAKAATPEGKGISLQSASLLQLPAGATALEDKSLRHYNAFAAPIDHEPHPALVTLPKPRRVPKSCAVPHLPTPSPKPEIAILNRSQF
jgi:hypothetical protein